MKNTFQLSRRKQAGITLVETAVALAIAAVVVSAAFAGFQANARRSEVRDNSQAITEMIADSKQLFGQSNRYNELITANAVAARIVPPSMLDAAGTGTLNSYGGAVHFSPDAAKDDQTILTFTGVPEKQCMDLVASTERSALGVAVDNAAAGTAVTTSATLTGQVKDPTDTNASLSMTALEGVCKSSTTGKYDVAFVFGRG